MKSLRKWGLLLLTGGVVLASVLLPRQISAFRDRQVLDTVHTQPMSEEDLTLQEASLPEKLGLLGRAIRYPDLQVYSATQPLEESGEAEAETLFLQGVENLAAWDILPEDYDRTTLAFQGGSRVVYVRADGSLSASMLYLQGITDSGDDFWMVLDAELGVPVWIDCTLRSVRESLPSAEEVGQGFFCGLGLETRQYGPTVWEVEGSGGLVYSAAVSTRSGRVSVEPLGFVWDLFGENTAVVD